MGDGDARRATVLIVGTGHWGNPGLDIRNVEFDDMLAPGRQREIEECLAQLARFTPTKVVLEITRELVPAMNGDYRRYRAGEFALTANERQQLGFRLAAMAGHTEVYGIDWHDFDRPIPWERAIAYAVEHGQGHLVATLTSALEETDQEKAAEAERVRRTSVRDQLLGMNAPRRSKRATRSTWIWPRSGRAIPTSAPRSCCAGTGAT